MMYAQHDMGLYLRYAPKAFGSSLFFKITKWTGKCPYPIMSCTVCYD